MTQIFWWRGWAERVAGDRRCSDSDSLNEPRFNFFSDFSSDGLNFGRGSRPNRSCERGRAKSTSERHERGRGGAPLDQSLIAHPTLRSIGQHTSHNGHSRLFISLRRSPAELGQNLSEQRLLKKISVFCAYFLCIWQKGFLSRFRCFY